MLFVLELFDLPSYVSTNAIYYCLTSPVSYTWRRLCKMSKGDSTQYTVLYFGCSQKRKFYSLGHYMVSHSEDDVGRKALPAACKLHSTGNFHCSFKLSTPHRAAYFQQEPKNFTW